MFDVGHTCYCEANVTCCFYSYLLKVTIIRLGIVLLAFQSNYVPILHRIWNITRCWSNIITDSNLPHLYLSPPLGVTQLQFHEDLWRHKTRVPALLGLHSLRDPMFSRFHKYEDPYCRAEMYAGRRVACCALVSTVSMPTGQTDGRTPDRYVTLSARRGAASVINALCRLATDVWTHRHTMIAYTALS